MQKVGPEYKRQNSDDCINYSFANQTVSAQQMAASEALEKKVNACAAVRLSENQTTACIESANQMKESEEDQDLVRLKQILRQCSTTTNFDLEDVQAFLKCAKKRPVNKQPVIYRTSNKNARDLFIGETGNYLLLTAKEDEYMSQKKFRSIHYGLNLFTNELVAVTLLDKGESEDSPASKAARQEVEVLQKHCLNPPKYLIRLIEVGETENFIFYLTPFYKEGSLKGIIVSERVYFYPRLDILINDERVSQKLQKMSRKRVMPSNYAAYCSLLNIDYTLKSLEMGLECMKAVLYFHFRGIFHRDIKLENFFVKQVPQEETLQIVLGDLETACEITDEENLRKIVGTVVYFSPEKLALNLNLPVPCNSFKLTLGAEAWAVGCALYELYSPQPLTFQLDFPQHYTQEDEQKLYNKITEKTFAATLEKEIRSNILPSIADIVIGLLHPDPSKRFTVAEAYDKWLSVISDKTNSKK